MSRYKPGDWIEEAGGTKAADYVLPEITTLLLVGPRGAGKRACESNYKGL